MTSRATRLTFSARMPRSLDSSAESTKSAASWLCGWNSPATLPLVRARAWGSARIRCRRAPTRTTRGAGLPGNR